MTHAIFSRRALLAAGLATCAMAASAALLPGIGRAAPFVSDRITVRTEGTGPDVVLIPGVDASPRTWASTVAALPGYRYHLVQVAGFAGQPAGANKKGELLGPVADDIARYIASKGIKPAVVGHDLGGTLGMTIAARHPDLLSRLMVVDVLPDMELAFAGPHATPGERATTAAVIEADLRATTAQERGRRATRMVAGMVDTASMRPIAVDDSLRSDPGVSARAYRDVAVTNMIPELGRITVPVTGVYGQVWQEPLPLAQLDAVYMNAYAPVKHLMLRRIDDSAHFIMWDQPARFRKALKDFLDRR